MAWLRKAWRFVCRNWKWFAVGLAILVVSVLGVRYRGNLLKLRLLNHKLNVKRSEREIGRLEGRREIIREREDFVEGEIRGIDSKIERLQGKIRVSRGVVDRLSSREKLEEFKRLGY